MMKNRILYVLTVVTLVLGAFSAKTYVDNRNMGNNILTAAQDLPADDVALTWNIGEEAVPLAGGPGETGLGTAGAGQAADGSGAAGAGQAADGSGAAGPGQTADGPGAAGTGQAADGSGAADPGQTADGPAQATEHPNVQKVIDLVNAEREKAGLAPLTKNSALCSAAAVRAKELAASFSHTRPDGRSYKTAIEEAGIVLRGVGENVAMGYRNAEEVMSGWMGSEGHRNNILLGNYTAIGVGYYKADNGYCYWAQEFSY